MTFKRFENKQHPYRLGGRRVNATLSGDAKAPLLLIGANLRDAGFDPSKRYVYLWDAKRRIIGLEPDPAGFKVMKTKNSGHTSVSLSIQARGFCARFKITERLTCESFEEVKGTWFLKMRRTVL